MITMGPDMTDTLSILIEAALELCAAVPFEPVLGEGDMAHTGIWHDATLWTSVETLPITECPDRLLKLFDIAEARPDDFNWWGDFKFLSGHVIDVKPINPNRWKFDRRGWTGVSSETWDHVGDIKSDAHRDQTVRSYGYARMFWEAGLSLVKRNALDCEPLHYYRLIVPSESAHKELWVGMVAAA